MVDNERCAEDERFFLSNLWEKMEVQILGQDSVPISHEMNPQWVEVEGSHIPITRILCYPIEILNDPNPKIVEVVMPIGKVSITGVWVQSIPRQYPNFLIAYFLIWVFAYCLPNRLTRLDSSDSVLEILRNDIASHCRNNTILIQYCALNEILRMLSRALHCLMPDQCRVW